MPDVNILIYAHRREDPHHEFYKSWLQDLANGSEMFALSSLVATAFVRIVTHPSFRPYPTPLVQAVSVIDSLLSMPSCMLLEPDDNHWNLVRRICLETKSDGKLVGDAQHAAVALAHGCTWVTRDPDFDRFKASGLRVEVLAP
jgi:toxin-antitoxin system PIN domain toxin